MRGLTPERTRYLAATLALASTLLNACGGGDGGTGPEAPAAVASVTVTLTSPSIPEGQTTQATATLHDASGATLTGRAVSFSSSNNAVASVSPTGVVTGVAVGSASIVATSEGRTGSATLTVTASPRATADRPDAETGNQIHVMYVLPSDGVDRQLDLNGTLATSVGSWQNWLAGQTGGRRFRLDASAGGALDITFVRLARTNATMRAYGVFVRDTIEKDLAALGFSSPNKLYAVYYDGGSTFSCGAGAWPPALPGRVAAMYLQGTPPGAAACNTNPFVTSPLAPPGYLEFGMIHEVLHTLGFVPSNAPHHHLGGHVPEPNDLMYAGSVPWALPNLVLDVGRDDYYGENVPTATRNLRDSPYLLPASSGGM